MNLSYCKKYTCIFLLFIALNATAQLSYVDSLKTAILKQPEDSNKVNTLISISDSYRFSEQDSAIRYAEQALQLSQKIQYDNGIFWSLVVASSVYYVLGDYSKELSYTFKVLEISKKLNTPYTRGFSKGLVSDCYYNLGEYDTAMYYWRQVVNITENYLPDELCSVYGNSAHIFLGMQDYDSAMIYVQKSLERLRASPWLNKDDYASKRARSGLYEVLAEAFAGKKSYDSALYYFRKSLVYSTELPMELDEMDANVGLAALYKQRNMPDSAIWYASIASGKKIATNYPISLIKSADILTWCYARLKQPDSSLKYLQLAVSIKDRLFSRAKTMGFQHQLFAEREKQNEEAALTAALQRRYGLYLLFIVLVILVCIAAVVFKNRRIKQMQQMRNSIADDLHDDIGSTLSSINIMSDLAKEDAQNAAPLLSAISESASVMQENMNDIVWAVTPKNDRFENVMQRMNVFASELLDAKNIKFSFNSDSLLSDHRFTMKQRKNWYFFFKEAVNNAAKYSGAEKISVDILKKDAYVETIVTDNGKGFDTGTTFDGNGMETLKKRAKELNGLFNISSKLGHGTIVWMRFKIT